MGKIKTDDKSRISGKTEVKCEEDSALSSVISSIPKKSRNDDVKLLKNNLNDEMFDIQSSKVSLKGAVMSKTRENRTTSRSTRKPKKNEVAEVGEGIFTTKVKGVKEMMPSSRSSSTVASSSKSEVTSSKRLMTSESSSQYCSDNEETIFTRLKRVGIPSVHIQRINSTEPALFSLSDKCDGVEGESARTVFTNTEATDLSKGQGKNCRQLHSPDFREISAKEISVVKDEPCCHSPTGVVSQKPNTFKIKQENDSDGDRSAEPADVDGRQGKASSVVIPVLAKFGEELMTAKQSSDSSQSKCCMADGGEGLIADKQSKSISKDATASDSGCDDVVVLSVDNSRSKTARKARSDASRKRSGTDDISCTMSIKREPCAEQNAATAEIIAHGSSELDGRTFVDVDAPKKNPRTSSKNVGAKSAKKTKSTKSRQSPGCTSVPSSILTRSMIKVPG